MEDLSAEDQDEYFATDEDRTEVDPGEDAPAALAIQAAAPYAFGPALASLVDRDGNLDAAYADPPDTDEHLFDPVSFVEGDEPHDVDAPALPDGATEIDDGEFGVMAWFTVLAERLDADVALAAVDGWGGDQYRSYESDAGSVCVRVDVRGETPSDTQGIAVRAAIVGRLTSRGVRHRGRRHRRRSRALRIVRPRRRAPAHHRQQLRRARFCLRAVPTSRMSSSVRASSRRPPGARPPAWSVSSPSRSSHRTTRHDSRILRSSNASPTSQVSAPLSRSTIHLVKAAVYYETGPPDVFRYEDVPDPACRPGVRAHRGRGDQHRGRRHAAPLRRRDDVDPAHRRLPVRGHDSSRSATA